MAKILIVDDSALSRKMLGTILTGAGHQVIEESDGMAGIERYFLDRPDLVTLDLTMKGLHGLEVLKKLLALDADARILIASADIQKSSRDLALDSGARGFVNKPFEPQAVLDAVEHALEERDHDPQR